MLIKRCNKQHARKILKYFDYSCLVETIMKNHDRIKAADNYYSIHLYTFISSYKKVRLKKKIGMATNTYTREIHGKRHDLMRFTFFRTFSKLCHFITSDAIIVIHTSF